jgi:hypothetical protein
MQTPCAFGATRENDELPLVVPRTALASASLTPHQNETARIPDPCRRDCCRPDKFEFVINLKTAKALNIQIP